MSEQAQMFPEPPKSRLEIAEEFVEHFQENVEKAETAVGNARRKLREAQVLRDDAEENLRRAISDENGEDAGTITCESCQLHVMCCDAEGWSRTADDCDLCPKCAAELAAESDSDAEEPEVDPITGEVPGGLVFVHYPDAEDYIETKVGAYTRFGELVADYITEAGLDTWTKAFMVLDAETGDLCEQSDTIGAASYGRRYAVLPAPESKETAA